MNKEEIRSKLIEILGEQFVKDHYSESEMKAMVFGFSIGFTNGELEQIKKFYNTAKNEG